MKMIGAKMTIAVLLSLSSKSAWALVCPGNWNPSFTDVLYREYTLDVQNPGEWWTPYDMVRTLVHDWVYFFDVPALLPMCGGTIVTGDPSYNFDSPYGGNCNEEYGNVECSEGVTVEYLCCE